MAGSFTEVVDLVNDPICRKVMERDGVKPTEVFNLIRTVHPVVGGGRGFVPPASRSAFWTGSPERRAMPR